MWILTSTTQYTPEVRRPRPLSSVNNWVYIGNPTRKVYVLWHRTVEGSRVGGRGLTPFRYKLLLPNETLTVLPGHFSPMLLSEQRKFWKPIWCSWEEEGLKVPHNDFNYLFDVSGDVGYLLGWGSYRECRQRLTSFVYRLEVSTSL